MRLRESLGDFLASLLVLAKGIRDNKSVLTSRDVGENVADSIEAQVHECYVLNAEQESLKAKLKEKTAELDATIEELYKEQAQGRGIIKIDMPQASWREFGIDDKR